MEIGLPIFAGKRFLDKDLNRCFGDLEASGTLIEEIRAQELAPLLKGTDILIDLHSTIKPSVPFVCVPKFDHPAAEIIPFFNTQHIITGDGLLTQDGKPIYADTFVNAHGGFGITVESGYENNSMLVELIRDSVISALKHLGVLQGKLECGLSRAVIEKTPYPLEECTIWDAYWNVIAGENFSWTKPWGNFDSMPAGTHFATSDSTKLVAEENSIILFPKDGANIIPGSEVCIIAKKQE